MGLIGVSYKLSLERAKDARLEVIFTEAIIETIEAAEITADRQGYITLGKTHIYLVEVEEEERCLSIGRKVLWCYIKET